MFQCTLLRRFFLQEQQDLFAAVASILHLGNVEFVTGDSDVVQISDKDDSFQIVLVIVNVWQIKY